MREIGPCSVEGCNRYHMYNSPVCSKHKGQKPKPEKKQVTETNRPSGEDLWWTEKIEGDTSSLKKEIKLNDEKSISAKNDEGEGKVDYFVLFLELLFALGGLIVTCFTILFLAWMVWSLFI